MFTLEQVEPLLGESRYGVRSVKQVDLRCRSRNPGKCYAPACLAAGRPRSYYQFHEAQHHERGCVVKRVYVVDDDKSIVESLSIVLESAGYEVGAQYDDKNVVDNVADFSADLIILDVMFPEDSGAGFKLARALKADERTSLACLSSCSPPSTRREHTRAASPIVT